jgi:hypothetical protein
MNELPEGWVTCKVHGAQPGGIVCKHLGHGGIGLGFYQAVDEDGEEALDALCYECALMVERVGGWDNVPNASDLLICICEGCFKEVESFNRLRLVSETDGSGS